jgi:hypothetical protein
MFFFNSMLPYKTGNLPYKTGKLPYGTGIFTYKTGIFTYEKLDKWNKMKKNEKITRFKNGWINN